MPEEKPKCPECDTELTLVDGKTPDKCAKCGFVLEGYEPFKRWMKAMQKEEKAAAQKKADDEKKTKKSSHPFGSLTR